MASPLGWRCTNGNGPLRRKRSPRSPSGPKQHPSFSTHLRKFSLLMIHRTTKRTWFQWWWWRFQFRGQQRLWRRRWWVWLWKWIGGGKYYSKWTRRNTGHSNHPPINRIRWKQLWFRRWRGTYSNTRWSNLSQATTTTWAMTNQPPNGIWISRNALHSSSRKPRRKDWIKLIRF